MLTNRLILGTANLGLGEGGRANAFAILDAYVGLGGAVIDTASVYSNWVPGELQRSETIIGEWMKDRGNRDHLRIVTKARTRRSATWTSPVAIQPRCAMTSS